MKFSEHVRKTPQAIVDTFNHDHDFIPLPKNIRRVYIVGSGSSYSQAMYLAHLFNERSNIKALYYNPYSFVRYSNFNKDDVYIHFSQEAKRNDNICPLNFAKNKGGRVVLFTSKPEKSLVKEVDESYFYTPEVEKILVASMSYGSGYAVALKYFNFQMKHLNQVGINYNLEKLESVMNKILNNNYVVGDLFTTYLYSGYGQSVAIEGALKVNECFLQDGESYEIKHYSHGKHFVSYNNDRLFNVICHNKDRDLVDLYKKSIFEDHHLVNYFESDLTPELAVFDWLMQMLVFTANSMKYKSIELEDIPVRDKIRLPHNFKY